MHSDPSATASPAAWGSESFSSPADYSLTLSDAQRIDMLAAVQRFTPAQLAEVSTLGKADFGFSASVAQTFGRGFEMLRDGIGFVVLKNLPADGLTVEQYVAAVWGVGLHFGFALSQNVNGSLIDQVLDASAVDPTPRMYRSNLELRPHTDITAMIGLACWQRSKSGGTSVIVSGARVHETIRRESPELLEPLYRGFHYHLLGEEAPGEKPVTPFRVPVLAVNGEQVSVRYLRANLVAGHQALGIPITELELAALDKFDQVARRPENRLAFNLERGDMLLSNNYVVMHARTSFEQYPEPERKRRLIRLWLDAKDFRQVPREFMFFSGLNGVPPQTGKAATFDFKKLMKDNPGALGDVRLQLGESEVIR